MIFAIPCLLGLEGLVADELRRLAMQNVRAENGRVYFEGGERELARANICLRHAERIQILLGSFHAVTFEELFQGVKALPIEDWVGKDDAFLIKGYSLNSKLFSVRDCQAITKKALAEELMAYYHMPWCEENGEKYPVNVAIHSDQARVTLDACGEALNRRGYRTWNGEAPLRETLAAAMILLILSVFLSRMQICVA